MTSASTVQFLGAAGCVTGSKYLLRSRGKATLVDCGLFQGLKKLRLRNWEPLPFPPTSIDQVILTHAHIDHTGYLPRLWKDGFKGPIYCTPSTAELLRLLLPDCGHLQEEDAHFAAKHGYSKHSPPLPLFTAKDGEDVLRLLRAVPFHQRTEVEGGVSFRFHPAGHILGAGTLEVEMDGIRLWFSGDLGRYEDEVMSPPSEGVDADFIFVESTYGDRCHPNTDVASELALIINRTVKRGGVLLIPAFAVGRTQALLYHIRRLEDAKRIPRLPVYVDSPMAVDASAVYCQFGREPGLRLDLTMGEGDCCPLRCREAHFIRTVDESKALGTRELPAIIISASGMATGGRVLHHLAQRLPDARNTVLLVGYQAEGTRGRALLGGAKELKMHGKMVPVKAQISALGGLSAHGDQSDLLRWLSSVKNAPRRVFLVHGEEPGLRGLEAEIQKRFGWPTHIPEYLESVDLELAP
jgi:metallo-beta-lactamase family protein